MASIPTMTYYTIANGTPLLDEAIALGCMTDHHCADLYIKDSPTVQTLVEKFNAMSHVTAKPFMAKDGKQWWEFGYQYYPFWESRSVGRGFRE